MRDGARAGGHRSWRPLLLSGLVGGLYGIGVAPAAAQRAIPVPPGLAPAAAPLVLRGVTVLDVRTGRHLPNRTVVIAGTRIRALGRAGQVRVPRAAHVVDARGKYLIPGLWDMHVHLQEYADETYPLLIANGVTGVRDAGSRAPLATLSQWKREIAGGTRVGPRLIVSGPQIADAPDTQTAVTYNYSFPARHQLFVPLAAARRVVDSLKAAGADMLKTYMSNPALRWAVVAEAKRVGLRFGGHADNGDEFSDSGATIVDHSASLIPNICGENPGGSEAPELAHFDGPRCAAAVQRFWRNNTWIAVTWGMPGGEFQLAQVRRYVAEQGLMHGVLSASGRGKVPASGLNLNRTAAEESRDSVVAAQWPPSTAAWEELLRQRLATEKGLDSSWVSDRGRPLVDSLRKYHIRFPYVIGTDAGYFGNIWAVTRPGFMVHDLLLLMTWPRISAAIAPFHQPTLLAALQTATLNPALALQATDSLGTVERGKLADLVLLDADPLQDIVNTTKIRAVIANGRYYDRAALDALLEAAHQAAVAARAGAKQP